jgi:hypothetical protein
MKISEAKRSHVKPISVILERSEGHPPLRGENPGSGTRFALRLCARLCEGDRTGSPWFVFALLLGAMLLAAPCAQAGGLKQSVVVSDPNSVPANEASVDTGGRTSANAYGTDGTTPHQLLTDGNGRVYVNINNNNAAAAPTNPYLNAALTAAATVTSSNGHYYGYDLYNPNVSVCYLQILSTATPTLGATVPVNSIPVPATSRAALTSPMSSLGPTAGGAPISIAATTTPAGSTLCTTGMAVNVWYTNF